MALKVKAVKKLVKFKKDDLGTWRYMGVSRGVMQALGRSW